MENDDENGDKKFSLELANKDNEIEKQYNDNNDNNSKTTADISEEKEEGRKIKYIEIINSLKNYHNGIGFDYDKDFICNMLLFSKEIELPIKLSLLKIILDSNISQLSNHDAMVIGEKLRKRKELYNTLDRATLTDIFYKISKKLSKDLIMYSRLYIYEMAEINNNFEIKDEIFIRAQKGMDENTKIIKEHKSVMKEIQQISGSEKYLYIQKIIEDLLEGKYNINKNNDDNYIYIINKIWLIKAKKYIEDYFRASKNNDMETFMESSFNLTFKNYFNNNIEDEKNNKENQQGKVEKKGKKNKTIYSKFPDAIDNFSLTKFIYKWEDPINKDENCYLKDELEINKNYYFIKKEDWDSLSSLFGSTNELLRKKDNLDLVQIKLIIFDRRICKKNQNTNLLRQKNIQINKDSNIKQLKFKIKNLVNHHLKAYIGGKKIKDQNVYFYTLDKKDKLNLIEICFAFLLNCKDDQQYESLNLNELELLDDNNLDDLFSKYNKKEHILIVEIVNDKEAKFFLDLKKIFPYKDYKCRICDKDIHNFKGKFSCKLCDFSIFCSSSCEKKSIFHKNLDKELKIIYEDKTTFDLSNLLDYPTEKIPSSNNGLGGINGLKNIGNTCYFNSSFQCLFHTKNLTKYFLIFDQAKDINSVSSFDQGLITKAYYTLVINMWNSQQQVIVPTHFLRAYHSKEKDFVIQQQQDAHEFIISLLNILHEDLNRVTKKKYQEIQEKGEDETVQSASERFWRYYKSREDSIIHDFFVGQFQCTTTCLECSFSSTVFDNFLDLQLPIPTKKLQYQIKLLTNDGELITLNIKIDDEIKLSDIIFKAIELLDQEKYIKYLSSNKIEGVIFNYNNKKVPKKILYNSIMVVELEEKFKMTKIYKTDFPKESKGEKKDQTNEEEIVLIENYNNYKLSEFYSQNKNRDIILIQREFQYIQRKNIDIFVYPITEIDKKGIFSTSKKMLKLSYPILISVEKDISNDNLKLIISKKLSSILVEKEGIEICLPHFNNQWKIFDFPNSKCPLCGNGYKTGKFCKLENVKENIIGKLLNIQAFKSKELILFAYLKKYNEKGRVYKNIELFDINTKNKIESSNKNMNIYDALDLFKDEEILDKENKWYCPSCKKHQMAKKKMDIYRIPNYLIVQFKRFKKRGAVMNFLLGQKNETEIDYKETLNLKDFVVGPDKDKAIYELYAVILHIKIMNGGHYQSICKVNGTWFLFDDSKVKYPDNIWNKDAYLLFYKLKNID